MSPSQYINTLPEKAQVVIWRYLYDLDVDMDVFTIHDINNAMNSRISDLEEIISYSDIVELIEKAGR